MILSEPIRVLNVIGYMDRGGAENMIMNFYRNVDRTKIQFDFVENEGDETAFDEEIRELGGRIYHCPRYRGKNHFAYTRWWHTFFKEHPNEYPIVHGHIGSTAAIYLSIAKKHGAFTIAHSHSAGEGSVMYRMFSYPARFVADHFFACSKAAGISRYGKRVGMDGYRCNVLNNAVDAKKFAYSLEDRAQMRKELGIAEKALVVGHTGRFVDVKNHTFLLDIFAALLKKEPNARLLLVGGGELQSQIEAKIQNLNLEEQVILAGIQNNVWDYYQGMILPAVGSFFLTLLICAFAKGEKWMHPLVIVAIGIIMYAITGMDLGSGFTFASIFYGFPSFLAMGIYVLFCVLGEIGEERAEEAMRKWEEKNTGEF